MFIAVAGIVLAVVMALLGALARISRNPVAYGVAGFYVSFFRGTPLIVQMFLLYLALPPVGRNLAASYTWLPEGFDQAFVLEATTAGILALGLNYGAYMTEIFRAGIQSVAGGQGEAADALGMTYGQKMRKVVLPQAFRVIIPPTGNEFIAMMKDTALVSFLGVTVATAEVFRRSQLVGKADFKNLEAYVAAALVYWGLTVLFTFFQARLESAHRPGLRPGPRRPRHAGPGAALMTTGHETARRGGPHRRAAQELRPPRGGARRRPGGAPRRGGGDLRPLRLGEVDGAALRELHRGPHRRARSRSPASASRAGTAPAASASRSASCGCTWAWSSSSSTCSRT